MACILYSAEKIHKEASTVVDYVPAYFFHLYREGILSIFDLYYQDLAKEAKQINGQLYCKDELELNKAIKDDVDLEQII